MDAGQLVLRHRGSSFSSLCNSGSAALGALRPYLWRLLQATEQDGGDGGALAKMAKEALGCLEQNRGRQPPATVPPAAPD